MGERLNDPNVVLEEKTKLDKPKLFRVLLLNDDYTTMEFVIFVLQAVFHKDSEDAHTLMWQIHQSGAGICGVFTYEIAEMKVATVEEMARQNEFPLRAIMEEDE